MKTNLLSHHSSRKTKTIKVSAIVLAAGSSSRMKKWKLEIVLKHKPLILYSVNSLITKCNEVIVVGGYNFTKLKEILRQVNSRKIMLIENTNYVDGMFSSIKCGITKTKYDKVFISLADMPFVKKAVYDLLLKEMQKNSTYNYFQPIIKIKNKKKKGHPILIDENVKKEILAVDNKNTLRDILKNFKGKMVEVKDKSILLDIDTESDFINAKTFFIKNKKVT